MSEKINIPEVGEFEKVSFAEFASSVKKLCPDYNHDQLVALYDSIKLPKRQTAGSAGYDFYIPMSICFKPGKTVKIPTGIKCKISSGWWLSLMVRSSVGTKRNIRFANTLPVIDSDYYGCPANEGHIILPLAMALTDPEGNPSEEFITSPDERLCQGIFLPYGITVNDDANAERTGGFGSTQKA